MQEKYNLWELHIIENSIDINYKIYIKLFVFQRYMSMMGGLKKRINEFVFHIILMY